jgi:hypothetical protein
MRSLSNLNALFEQAEFFIDAVSGYECDFALFPEFFTPMADFNHLSEVREPGNIEAVKLKFQEFAISYYQYHQGSLPFIERNMYMWLKQDVYK